jgi:hypothetical protein
LFLILIPYLLATRKDPTLITSYKDAIHYQPEEDENQIIIELDIYGDEFDTKVGQSSGNLTKLTAIYYTIGNVPYYQQSKRQDILLSTIISKQNMSSVTIFNLFKPFVHSLNELNHNPIKIDNFYFTFRIKASIGDNLFSNLAAKVCANFTLDACRDCGISFKDLILFHSDQLSLNKLPKARTLNPNHALKDAPYDAPDLYVKDTTHDLDEGKNFLKL